jgi:ribokinase
MTGKAGNKRRSFEVFGLGQCPLDYLGKIDAYPPPDAKCEFRGLTMEGGGPAATALVALARWGVSCAFSGVVGSQFAFIVAEPGLARRTIFWRRPTGPPPKPEELDLEAIRKARVLHVDGLYPEVTLAACKAIKETGGQIVVDAGTLREGMLDLARVSDCFVVSEAFAMSLVGDRRPLDACRRLAQLGPNVVGVTLGARGYVALVDGRVIEKPAYPVEAVDTTGCGDAFHAGLTYGIIKGWDMDKTLDFGAWAAAMVSRKLGGRAGIPTLEEIRSQGF